MRLKNHLVFIYWLVAYFISGLILLVTTKHGEAELYINKKHQVYFDYFFKYWTYVGDGWFIAIVIIGLLFYRFYAALLCFTAIIIQTLIVHYFKNYLFHLEPRPRTYLKEYPLYFVNGVEIHGINSFPSGHTAQAFCMAAVLALILSDTRFRNNGLIQTGLFLIALLVGLSRIYLMQHFLRDTLAGACIGCLSAYATYLIFEKWKTNNKNLQKSLLTLNN